MINLAQSALFLQKQEAPEGKINVKNNNHNALLADYTRTQPGKNTLNGKSGLFMKVFCTFKPQVENTYRANTHVIVHDIQ